MNRPRNQSTILQTDESGLQAPIFSEGDGAALPMLLSPDSERSEPNVYIIYKER